MHNSIEGYAKKCILVFELVREDDPEYQEAQAKIKAFKKQLGIEDAPVDKSEKKSSKPGMQEYHGGYPLWTDKHKCLLILNECNIFFIFFNSSSMFN